MAVRNNLVLQRNWSINLFSTACVGISHPLEKTRTLLHKLVSKENPIKFN
jgi:hypothetical protein